MSYKFQDFGDVDLQVPNWPPVEKRVLSLKAGVPVDLCPANLLFVVEREEGAIRRHDSPSKEVPKFKARSGDGLHGLPGRKLQCEDAGRCCCCSVLAKSLA